MMKLASSFAARETQARLLIAFLIASASMACGVEGGGPGSKEASEGDDAGAAGTVVARRVAVTHELAAAMAASSNVVLTRLYLANPEVAAPLPAAVASGVVDASGQLTASVLNGAAAGKDEFDAYAAQLQATLGQRYAQVVEARRRGWADVASRFGLSRELAGVMESGATSVEVELPTSVARAIAQDAAGPIHAMSHHVEGSPSNVSLSTALGSLGLTSSAFPSGWTGSGTGIFLSDFGQPSTSGSNADCVNNSRLVLASGTTNGIADHATLMVCLLQNAAPGAQVYYRTDYGTDGADVPPDLLTRTPAIYVSSMSDNWDGAGAYTAGDAAFDDRIFNTRVAHFNSTGNAGSYVASPSVAYNVMSIGNWNSASNVVDSSSSYLDPITTTAHKPELVAPGIGVTVSTYFQGVSGTSVSTPLAAAFADDLMQEFSFLRYQPALLKAYLMVNGIRVNADGVVVGDKDGAGHPDFATAQFGAWLWANGTDAQVFTTDSNGDGHKDVVLQVGLNAGWNYNAVMSFLVNGDYVLANGRPNMDLDLYVTAPNGTTVTSSTSSFQSHEAVRFTAPTTGTYKIRVERFSYSGTGDVSLGVVVRGR
jgi:hypothetical protein